MTSVPLAPLYLRSQTRELFLMRGKEDVDGAGTTILLRARDVTEKNFGAIPDFAKQLGARSETGPSKRDCQSRSQAPLPTTAPQLFPPGRESIVGGCSPTSVVSNATVARMLVDETTS